MCIYVGGVPRLVMKSVGRAHPAATVKPEAMENVVKEIIEHQDDHNIEQYLPQWSCGSGNTKWQDRYKKGDIAD